MKQKHHIILAGNPGAGKSTFLNGFIGEKKFKSGVNFEGGMTTVMQLEEHNNVFYGDTPGLADPRPHIKEQAAKEIEKILREKGTFQLIFVVTLEAGRVRDQDNMMMKAILEALNNDKVYYGILINKVSTKLMNILNQDELARDKIKVTANLNHTPTQYFYLQREVEDLKDENDKVPQIDPELRDWIQNIPITGHIPENVKSIDVSNWEKKLNELQNQISDMMRINGELVKQNQALEGRINQLNQARKPTFWNSLLGGVLSTISNVILPGLGGFLVGKLK